MDNKKAGLLLLIVLIAGGVGYFSYRVTDQNLLISSQGLFATRVTELHSGLESRLSGIATSLLAAKALFLSSNEITQAEWSTFVETTSTNSITPDFSSFFFARYVDSDKIVGYVKSFAAEHPELDILDPVDIGDLNLVIKYIHPSNPIKDKALGYNIDLSSNDPIFTDVVEGSMGTTGIREFIRTEQSSLVLSYLSVNKDDQLLGVVAIAFVPEQFFSEFFAQNRSGEDIHIQVVDRDGINIFRSRYYDDSLSADGLQDEVLIETADAEWSVMFSTDKYFGISQGERILVFISGIGAGTTALVLMLMGYGYFLISGRKYLELSEQIRIELVKLISHQIKTPATSIKWVMDILESSPDLTTEQKQEHLREILASSSIITRVVDDLLTVAEIDNAKEIKPYRKQITISNLVMKSIGLVSEYSDQKQTKVTINHKQQDLVVNVDEEMMMQALSHIIRNAIDYSPENSEVSIVTFKVGRTVVIRIRDHGIGLNEADKRNIIRRFYRGEEASRIKSEGSGVGLYIASRWIGAHDGDLNFESKKGEGTVVTVRVPIKS